MTLTESKQYGIKRLAMNAGKVIATLLDPQCKQAIKYILPELRIKATKLIRDNGIADIRLNIGPPSYAERKFIKNCEKAGEPFPVKKIQIRRKK